MKEGKNVFVKESNNVYINICMICKKKKNRYQCVHVITNIAVNIHSEKQKRSISIVFIEIDKAALNSSS